jgi:hypothetical protein
MNNSKLEKWLPLTGLLFLALIIAAFVLPSSPDTGVTTEKAVAFYHDHRSEAMISSMLVAWAGLMVAFFSGSLRNHLAKSESGGLMSSLVLAGGVLLGGGLMLMASTIFAAADAVNKVDPATLRVLHVISNEFFIPFLGGWALFQLSAGAAILRTRALPVWLGWLALVLGVVAITPVGWFGFLLGVIWVGIVSILMIARYGKEEASAPPAPKEPEPAAVAV